MKVTDEMVKVALNAMKMAGQEPSSDMYVVVKGALEDVFSTTEKDKTSGDGLSQLEKNKLASTVAEHTLTSPKPAVCLHDERWIWRENNYDENRHGTWPEFKAPKEKMPTEPKKEWQIALEKQFGCKEKEKFAQREYNHRLSYMMNGMAGNPKSAVSSLSRADMIQERRAELKRTIDTFWGVNQKLITKITNLKYQRNILILLLVFVCIFQNI